VPAASTPPQPAGRGALTLVAARALLDGALATGPVAIGVRDGRIVAVERRPPRRGDVVLDEGIVSPGLVDLQVNGAAGVDLAAADPAGWRRVAAHLAGHGVTAFCPTFITAPVAELAAAVRRSARAARRLAGDPVAQPVGAHVEGPFLAPARAGVHPRDLLRPPTAEAVDALLAAAADAGGPRPSAPGPAGAADGERPAGAAGPRAERAAAGERPAGAAGPRAARAAAGERGQGGPRSAGAAAGEAAFALRIVTLAPELPGALEAIGRLRAAGVRVSVGHSEAGAARTAAAADAGATLVTHLFNAMPPLAAREPGVAGRALADERLTCGLIADLHHVAPELVRLAFAAAPGRVALVSDATAAAGMPPGPCRLGPVTAIGHAHGPPTLADGTIAGSALHLDEAVRNVVGLGVAPAVALAAATAVPARAAGLEDRGRIAPGARADLVWWNDALHVRRVWIGGREAR
jgi:N-acetylglucosamine-6-phosphate deacetylase